MRMIKTTDSRRRALTASIVIVVVIATVALSSCSRDPLVDVGDPQQGQTASADSLLPSQESRSESAQESSELLPPPSSAEENGEEEVIVYEHTDATRYRSPVDTMDVAWELLDDNEVRITSEKQEAVYAAEAGKAIVKKRPGSDDPFNFVLIVHDNGTETLYRHLDNFAVEFEERVEKGQKLAEMQEANGHYSFRFSVRRYIGENLEIIIPSD